jgi:basic amino acid/polyamine antiporter, APA family
MSETPRALGREDVLALGVNCVVGSGIFLLPGLAAARLGPAAVLAFLAAGLLACLVALCFAEAASRFRRSGGAYLYVREAFGPLAGFEVGWLAALAGIVAWSALAAGFAEAFAVVVPAAGGRVARGAVALTLVALLGAINYRGAKAGARLSNLFTVAKLLTLTVFVAAGALAVNPDLFTPFWSIAPEGEAAVRAGPAAFAGTVLLVLYAYVGFENLVVPAGDMEAPERALPRGIVTVLVTVAVLYTAAQAVVVGILGPAAGAAGTEALARAAEHALGSAGGLAVAVGIVISIFGVNAASSLILPRRVSALAEHGDLPATLARLHPRFGTPAASVVGVHAAVGLLALSGTFAQLAVLAVIGRLIQYIPTCLAVLVLRRRAGSPEGRREETAAFRLPGGPTIPVLAIVLCVALLLQATPVQLGAGAAAALAGLAVYALRRG